jgi:hypothetical protein
MIVIAVLRFDDLDVGWSESTERGNVIGPTENTEWDVRQGARDCQNVMDTLAGIQLAGKHNRRLATLVRRKSGIIDARLDHHVIGCADSLRRRVAIRLAEEYPAVIGTADQKPLPCLEHPTDERPLHCPPGWSEQPKYLAHHWPVRAPGREQ